MPTKPTTSFSVPASSVFIQEVASGLCTSFLSTGIEKNVTIRESSDGPLRITVRPLCIATDLPVLYKWMSREYAGPLLTRTQPPHELEEFYTCMIESDFAQPFMGLIGDVPVCQVDVCKSQQDAISLHYNARPGDYHMQLVSAPLAVQQNMILLVRTCLEYFFSFPEVGRIVADIDTENEWNNTLFKKAGFRNIQQIQTPYKSSTLYICTRSSLMH
ncbi:MAG: GNAT family N-acetyltransferase [Chitinophagaceae bacterium]|nr:GNAT family N-acetyltransferase [Chitinophagaceae bacterium]